MKVSSVQENNLKNSLESYSTAMEENNKTIKFRDLFTALEKVTDIDGNQIIEDAFDKKVITLYAVNPTNVKDWRLFYNRIKHAQRRNSKDINKYYTGQEKLPETLPAIRKCVQNILLSKLK